MKNEIWLIYDKKSKFIVGGYAEKANAEKAIVKYPSGQLLRLQLQDVEPKKEESCQ